MKLRTLSVIGLLLPMLARASIVWDTLAGSTNEGTLASYQDIAFGGGPLIATEISLTATSTIIDLELAGYHGYTSGSSFVDTDPTNSTYRLNFFSSLAAFENQPLVGDVASVSPVSLVTSPYTAGPTGKIRTLFDFTLTGVTLPKGTSFVSVFSESLPTTTGALFWAGSSDQAPDGFGLPDGAGQASDVGFPMSLQLTTPVPEPTSLIALSLGVVPLLVALWP